MVFYSYKIQVKNMNEFQKEVAARIAAFPTESEMCQAAEAFIRASTKPKYSYNFSFLGRPIIQYPQDMVAIQELIWSVKPDLIIETGIAHGGSLIMSAAMLALLDYCDAVSAQTPLNPLASRRQVLGVDIEIRAHNRAAITAHPVAHKIKMLEGSSLDSGIIRNISEIACNYERIMVLLDSHHTCDHVIGELQAYAPLTSVGSYCVVFDTIVDKLLLRAS